MEQRRQYRTVRSETLAINVAVLGTGNRNHDAALLDASATGIRILLPRRPTAPTDLGASIVLVFTSKLLERYIEASAVVVQSAETDVGLELGLKFADWLGLAARLPVALRELFNGRADPRLELDPEYQPEVVVRGLDLDFEIHAQLRDISRSGMRVVAPILAECALRRTELCALEFELPDNSQLFSLGGRIRHRALHGDSVEYGVWFDAGLTKDFDEQQDAIAEFVEDRIDAALRELAET